MGVIARTPRLLLLGLVPGMIAFLVVVVALGLLIYFANDVAALLTWFANRWSPGARDAVRLLAAIAVVGVSIVVAVLTFTALTLTIGDPFYETISKHVDDRFGGAAGAEAPWAKALARNLVDSVRLVLLSLFTSVITFFVGLIPVVGQAALPVLGALIGGWLLAVEISGVPFNRRGLRLRDRRRLLRANRSLALGFGVPIFMIFLVPLLAIVVMPGA